MGGFGISHNFFSRLVFSRLPAAPLRVLCTQSLQTSVGSSKGRKRKVWRARDGATGYKCEIARRKAKLRREDGVAKQERQGKRGKANPVGTAGSCSRP